MLFRGTGQPARLPSSLFAFTWTELCWIGWKSCRSNLSQIKLKPFFTLILRRLGLDRSKLYLWWSQRGWGWSFFFLLQFDFNEITNPAQIEYALESWCQLIKSYDNCMYAKRWLYEVQYFESRFRSLVQLSARQMWRKPTVLACFVQAATRKEAAK